MLIPPVNMLNYSHKEFKFTKAYHEFSELNKRLVVWVQLIRIKLQSVSLIDYRDLMFSLKRWPNNGFVDNATKGY